MFIDLNYLQNILSLEIYKLKYKYNQLIPKCELGTFERYFHASCQQGINKSYAKVITFINENRGNIKDIKGIDDIKELISNELVELNKKVNYYNLKTIVKIKRFKKLWVCEAQIQGYIEILQLIRNL